MAKPLPDWEDVLRAASHLQRFVPDAVLVGGTATAIYAGHRSTQDADHTMSDLREHFDAVLADLEQVAGSNTARVRRPVLILGSLDGIETGVRELIRTEPLETVTLETIGGPIRLPTHAEILRIKATLIIKRNATRDYIDFIALADGLGDTLTVSALIKLDDYYPQPNSQSAIRQLIVQVCSPQPFDRDAVDLVSYRRLSPRYADWARLDQLGRGIAQTLFDALDKGRPRAASKQSSH